MNIDDTNLSDDIDTNLDMTSLYKKHVKPVQAGWAFHDEFNHTGGTPVSSNAASRTHIVFLEPRLSCLGKGDSLNVSQYSSTIPPLIHYM